MIASHAPRRPPFRAPVAHVPTGRAHARERVGGLGDVEDVAVLVDGLELGLRRDPAAAVHVTDHEVQLLADRDRVPRLDPVLPDDLRVAHADAVVLVPLHAEQVAFAVGLLRERERLDRVRGEVAELDVHVILRQERGARACARAPEIRRGNEAPARRARSRGARTSMYTKRSNWSIMRFISLRCSIVIASSSEPGRVSIWSVSEPRLGGAEHTASWAISSACCGVYGFLSAV